MANVGNVNVRITADTATMQRNLQNAQRSMNDFGSNMNKQLSGLKTAFVAFGVAAAAGLAVLTKSSIQTAMTFESSVQQINRIMGSSANEFLKWADTQASAFNMSKTDAVQYGSIYGNLLSSISKDSTETAKYTEDLLKASAVVASGTGRTIVDVMERIRSGLLGNTEAIEDLGINVNIALIESTKSFQKFANGKSWNQLDFNTQQTIRYFAIMEQAATKFGTTLNQNTSSSIAKLTAVLSNVKLNIGQAFLPLIQIVVPILIDFANSLVYVTGVFANFMRALFGVQVEQTKVATSGNQAAQAVGDVGSATKKAGKAAKGSTASFDEVNELMDKMASGADDAANAMGGVGGGSVATPQTNVGNVDTSAITEAKSKVEELRKTVENFYNNWGAKDLFDGIKKGIQNIDFTSFQTNLNSLGTILTNTSIALLPATQTTFQALGSAIGIAIGTGLSTSTGFINGILQGIVNSIPTFFANVNLSGILTNFTNIFNSISKIIDSTMPGAVNSSTALGSSIGISISGAVATTLTLFEAITGGISKFFTDNTPTITNFINLINTTMTQVFNDLSQTLTTIFGIITQTMSSNLPLIQGTINNILITLSTLVNTVTTITLSVIKSVLSSINIFIEENKTAIKTAFDNTIKIFTESLNSMSMISTDILNSIKDFWNKWGSEIFAGITSIFTDIAGWFLIFYNETLIPIFQTALDWLKKIWQDNLKGLIDQVLGFIGRLGQIALLVYENFIKPIINYFTQNLLPVIKDVIKLIIDVIGNIVNTLTGIVKDIFKILNGIIDFILGVFTGNWQKAWDGIKGIFTGVMDALVVVLKGVVNTLISSINFMIRGVNKLNVNIPETPFSKAYNIGFSIKEIPFLAQGGIITSPTVAMVGESGAEAVIPLENTSFIDTLASAIGSAVLNAMQFANPINTNQSSNEVVVNIDGTQMARIMLPKLENEQFRLGNRAILQGV